MKTTLVDSSVIFSIGYDETERVLKVRFRNGRTYAYLDVPPTAHDSLLTAGSIGKYFNERIKPNYDSVRIRE